MVVKFVPNRAGVVSFIAAPGVVKEVHRRTLAVARAAGADDHNVYLDNRRFGPRTRGAVVTATKRAREAQRADHNLTRALNAARG